MLFDADVGLLMQDVYFRPDFLDLHAAPDPVAATAGPSYRHGAAIRREPGGRFTDLETPHGYGGPVGRDADALRDGLAQWRRTQRDAGRRAEFIRVHPFIDPGALSPHLDFLQADRETVLVDLTRPRGDYLGAFSKGARHALRTAERTLSVRTLAAAEWPVMRDAHQAVYDRHDVAGPMRFTDDYYRRLLAMPWATTWCAERGGTPVAAGCFLCAGPILAHYHISGGGDEARRTNAHYLLLDRAIAHFAGLGVRWMHLGGGGTNLPADPLLRFKARFSPIRAHYHIGGIVFDPDLFRDTGGGRKGRFLSVAATGVTAA